jgi:hypothetical protein
MRPSGNAEKLTGTGVDPGSGVERPSPVDPVPAGGTRRPPRIRVSVVLFCSQSIVRPDEVLDGLLDFVHRSGPDHELIVAMDGHLGPLYQRFADRTASEAQVQLLRLNSRQGQVATIRAGLALCSGSSIITYPAYPQVSPDAIPFVLQALEEGNDYVVGYRRDRRDSAPNRLASALFNRLVRATTGIGFRDIACGIHGMRREITAAIPNYGDNQLFVPILLAREGFRVGEVGVPQSEIRRKLRMFTPATLMRRLLDLLTLSYLVRFTQKPLRPFGALGALLLIAGGVLGVVLAWQRIVQGVSLADRPMLLLALLLVTAGIQVIILGFLGELLIYLHFRDQVNSRVADRFDARDEKSRE